MEKISAACAMEWCLELEKALRSRNPDRSIEAIEKLGPRLVQWSKEPELTMAVYNMFGLVQGEDRLFANSILLRLADVFRFGDRSRKQAVVKMFLFHHKNLFNKKKGKHEYGILSKEKVHNQKELLSRVKFVFDTGDVEDRALALVLLGCWAEFANNSASIRYLVLSSMVSPESSEVKASLFAAECFCEFADDFASVVLEMLVNVMNSSETALAVRVGGARTFAKMGCSYAVVNKAYQAGIKLVLDSSEEEFIVPMLFSLSKVACKSALLISQQVDLLVSIFNSGKSVRVQETALRCLHFIFVKGVCLTSVGEPTIKLLYCKLEEPGLPSNLQFEVLKVFQKAILYTPPNLPCLEAVKFSKLLTIVENTFHPPDNLRRVAAIQALAALADKLKGGTETSSSLQFISLIIEQIALLVKPVLVPCRTEREVVQHVNRLLYLLHLMVRENPDLCLLVLDKINDFFQSLVNQDDVFTRGKKSTFTGRIFEFNGEKKPFMSSKFVRNLYKFLESVLEYLTEAGAITTHVFNRVKFLVNFIYQGSFCDCYTRTIYSLLLHSRIIWSCLPDGRCDGNIINISSHHFSIDQETLTIDCAKRLLEEKNYWYAYRAGVRAACQGAWFTASFLFEQLMSKVQSNFYSFWLKSLVQFAYSQRKFLLLLVKDQSTLIKWLEQNGFSTAHLEGDVDRVNQDCAGDVNMLNIGLSCSIASYYLRTSGELLGSIITSDCTFYFQRWYLSVSAKVLGIVSEIINGIDSMEPEQISNNQVEKSFVVKNSNSLSQITAKPLQMMTLARELDLIATTFIDMEAKSFRIISALALSCSLLAFSIRFSLFTPQAMHESLRLSDNCMNAMLIQDLIGRLWHIDRETSVNLSLLLKDSALPTKCSPLQSRNRIFKADCEVMGILVVFRHAVKRVTLLQHEAKGASDGKNMSSVTKDGIQLLLEIIIKWIAIPFRIPNYYFKVRRPIGSQLYAFCTDNSHQDGIYVLPGHCLSLNLCLQLKNIPPDLSIRVSKLYCVLQCRASYHMARSSIKKEDQIHAGVDEAEDIIELNEKLLCYVSECTRAAGCKRKKDNDSIIADAYLSFQPNERAQGFSSCLLDVSKFPAGCYRISWHSGCIDDKGSYWSLLSLNSGPVFTVQTPSRS